MRFQKKKAAALALALGVVGVLVTALPASAAAVTSFTPACGIVGTTVTITGSGFTGATQALFNAVTSPATVLNDTTATTTVPATAVTGPITVDGAGVDTPSATNFTVVAAAAPGTPTFAPASGAVGSTVIITGTNFCGTSSVQFNVASAVYTVNSATQITATVPVGATTGPIRVTVPGQPTANSAASFTVAPAPTITSFTPTSGPVGKSVTITGTNLTGVTGVKFNGVTATFGTSTATSVTATVPSGATTGKIAVTTPGGTVTSTTDFTVTVVTNHDRSVTLALKKHLVASGKVSVTDGFNACRSNVTVKIQRLVDGTWKVVGSDQTSGNGEYKANVKDKTGKYRAIAKKEKINGGADVCNVDYSATKKHQH